MAAHPPGTGGFQLLHGNPSRLLDLHPMTAEKSRPGFFNLVMPEQSSRLLNFSTSAGHPDSPGRHSLFCNRLLCDCPGMFALKIVVVGLDMLRVKK